MGHMAMRLVRILVLQCVYVYVGVSVDNVGMLSLLSSVLLTTQCMYDMGWLRTTLHARNI